MPAAKAPTRATARSRGRSAPADERRRGWIIFASAATVAVLMLAAWFPFSALVAQRHALSATQAQLTDLANQDRALAKEQAKLSDPAEISRLARQQYQLVQPGQKLVQVLPPSGAPSALGGAPTPGDPGLAPLVRPSAVALISGGTSTKAAASHAEAHPSASHGIVNRIVSSLEFWKG